jgi:hypothetical protein
MRNDEAAVVDVEVIDVDDRPPSLREVGRTNANPSRQAAPPPWSGWSGTIRRLDSRWWPLWVLLGVLALALLLTVGLVIGLILVVLRLTNRLLRAVFR